MIVVYVVSYTRGGALNSVAFTTRALALDWARLHTNGNYYISEMGVRSSP